MHGIGRIARANVPYTLELPREVSDPVPMVLAHGYLGTEDFYVPLRKYLAANGKPVVTYESARVQELLAGLHPKHFLHPERLLSQEVWAIMKNLLARNDLGLKIEQFDISGHSMGGPTCAAVAERRPDEVRHVVFNAPAGIEKHNFLKMLGRLPAFHSEELIPAILKGELAQFTGADIALRALYHIYRNPGRTMAEGIAVGNSNIHSSLLEMSLQGTKSAILAYKADLLCPAEGIFRDGSHRVDQNILFDLPRAGHLAPQIYPEFVGRVHLQILKALEDRPRKPKSSAPPLAAAA